MDNLNSFDDLDYEYTHNIKFDSAVPPPYDRTLNICWSRLPRGSKKGDGDIVAALPKDTRTTTQLPLPLRTSSACHQDPSESLRKAGHWGYFSLPSNVSLKICRYIVQQHSTDKPIRLSRWSVYTGLYPVNKDTMLVQGSEQETWESEFFETHNQALHALSPYLQANRRFRADLVAAFLLNRRYHLVISPFGPTTNIPWLAKFGRYLKYITMEFDCTRFYGGKPRTREKIEAATHSGVFNEQQLKTALAPGKDALESVKHYKCALTDVLKLLTCGRQSPVNRLTIMVRKYWGSRESMPQGYPYFDPTWLNFLLLIPSVLQSNVLNLETIGVPPRLLGLMITKFWGEGKPPTEDAQRPHFTWSPSPSTLWPEMPGQSAAISICGSVDLTADYLLRLDSPGQVEIHTFPSREAQKQQQSAKKRRKSRRKKTKKSSTLPKPEPEPVAGHEEQQSGEQAHFQSPSRISGSSTVAVEAGSSHQMESRAAKALGTFGSLGMARFWNERKKTELDEVSMSSPEKKALHMRRAQEKFAELSKLLEEASPQAPPDSSERLTVVDDIAALRTGTGLEAPRATLAGGFVPLLPHFSQPATRQQPPSQLPVTPASPDTSAVPIPMPDGKWTRLTDEDSRPSSAGSTAQSGNGAGDLTDSGDCADTRSGDKDVLGIEEECTLVKNKKRNKRKKRKNGKHTHSQAQHETSHADKVEASLKSLKDEWSATLGESSKMKQDKKKEESAAGPELGCSSNQAENKKAGENESEKSGGTLTSASSSKEATSKAGLPQSSQTAQVSPPPPSDLHIAGSCLGNSENMKSGERPGSQSPPELQLPPSSEASIPLPTLWLSMEVPRVRLFDVRLPMAPKEEIPNASDEDVKAGEEAKENKSSFPSQDTQVGGIASSKARNSKEKGKGRWTGSPKPVGEDKKVERKSASRPQPPLLRSETQIVQVPEPINQCQRPNYPHVSTKGFKQRPQGQPQRQQPHFHPKGLSTSASNPPPSQQPSLNGPEASALYHRYQKHGMDTLDMLRTMAQVQPMSQAPSISQGQVPVMHPLHPASQMPIMTQVPPVPRIPPSSLYSQAPITYQVPPMSQVQLQPMPQMQPFIHNPYYSQVPTTTMSQVPPIPPALSSQQMYPFQQQTYQPAHFPYPGHEQCNAQRCYQETAEHFHFPNVHQLPPPPPPPPPPPHPTNPELSGMASMPRYEDRNMYSGEVLPSQHLTHMAKASLPDTMNVPGMYPVVSASGSAIGSRNGNGSASESASESASGSTSIPHRNGISNGLIQYRVPIPAQAPNSNAEQAPWQRFTTAGDCTRSETGVCDDDDNGKREGYPTSFGKGGTGVSAPASGRLNGWHGPNEKKAKGKGNGKQVENKPECQWDDDLGRRKMKDGILSSRDTWTFESQYHQVQMALDDASRPLQVLEDISSESTLRQQTSTQPEMQAQTPTQPETELAIHMSEPEGLKETETSNEEPDGVSRDPNKPRYIPGHVPTHVPEYAPAYYVLADAPLCESEDMPDDPRWFEPEYTSTDVPTHRPADLPQNVPEDSSQSVPEYCPSEEEVSTTVSWYEREVLSNLSKGEKNRKVNGPWAYIAGATESDFKKQKKRNPKSKEREAKEREVKEHGVKDMDTETEKPAPSNPASPDPGATKLEEIRISDWWDYHIDAANESDFEKKKRDPKSNAADTKETDTKRPVPSKLASSDAGATKLEDIKFSDWWITTGGTHESIFGPIKIRRSETIS